MDAEAAIPQSSLAEFSPPYNGILFRAKKKWAIKPWKGMEETQMPTAKLKKLVWKGYTLYFFKCKTLWKRQNYGDPKKISGC